jgi:hypothetical protein
MKRSLVWTAVGAAVIGLGVPAYAASQSGNSTPTINTVKTTVQDLSGNCDEAEHANDPACTSTSAGVAMTKASEPSTSLEDSTKISVENSVDNSVEATENSVDDNGTDNSVDDDATENSVDDDDATQNSVEDVSGNCDEAEHANDPSCTGAAAPANSVDDNSGSGGGDDSGHHGGGDDGGNSGRGGGSDG